MSDPRAPWPVPAAEAERLRAVADYQGAQGQDALQRICDLAHSLFQTPIALITLVERDVTRALAASGPGGYEAVPRCDSFCSHAIAADTPLIVPDLSADARFADYPLVAPNGPLRFYAGAPLVTAPGVALGALCVVDFKPRAFTEADVRHLGLMADLVVKELQRQRALADLERREALLAHAAALANLGSWELEVSTSMFSASAETRRFYGVSPDEPLDLGRVASLYDEAEHVRLVSLFNKAIKYAVPIDSEIELRTPSGELRWGRLMAHPEQVDGRVTRLIGSVQDLTDRREAELERERLAYLDAVTGLPNRALFQRRLKEMLDARDEAADLHLLVLDIDHFKDVNDRLGHAAGDALLRAVGERLQGCAGEGEMVARLGGDEFAVIIRAAEPEIGARLEAILASLRAPVIYEGRVLSTSASVGVVACEGRGACLDHLLGDVDLALYAAKRAGRNRVAAFQPDMRAEFERRIDVLRDVRHALDAGEFELHYQPLVNLATEQPRGFEGLMRWRHPTRGVLTPAAFSAAFDDAELSISLGDLALDQAVRQMRSWLDAGLEFGRVAVNIAAAQFREGDLAEKILARLARFDVPARHLALEVTENVYLGRASDKVAPTVRQLHEAGVIIALDDFGTGYASLANLRHFPIDRIKIDKSFVQNAGDEAIVKAVIAMSAGLGMQVIAEGVEHPAQVEMLRRHGCDHAQGFHFARPMPPEDVPLYLLRALQAQPAAIAEAVAA